MCFVSFCCCLWSLVHLTVRSFVAWNIYVYIHYTYDIVTTCFDHSNGSLLFTLCFLFFRFTLHFSFSYFLWAYFTSCSVDQSFWICFLTRWSPACAHGIANVTLYTLFRFQISNLADHTGNCCYCSLFLVFYFVVILLLVSRTTIVLFIPIQLLI